MFDAVQLFENGDICILIESEEDSLAFVEMCQIYGFKWGEHSPATTDNIRINRIMSFGFDAQHALGFIDYDTDDDRTWYAENDDLNRPYVFTTMKEFLSNDAKFDIAPVDIGNIIRF